MANETTPECQAQALGQKLMAIITDANVRNGVAFYTLGVLACGLARTPDGASDEEPDTEQNQCCDHGFGDDR